MAFVHLVAEFFFYDQDHTRLYISNEPCWADTARCRVVLCHRSSGCYGSSSLSGHASTSFVLSLWPKAQPMGQFSCHAGPSSTSCRAASRPIKSITTHFHQYFHQMLYIYICITTTLTVHLDCYWTDHWNGPCPYLAMYLGACLGTTWFLGPWRSGPSGHRARPWVGPLSRGLHGHVYTTPTN